MVTLETKMPKNYEFGNEANGDNRTRREKDGAGQENPNQEQDPELVLSRFIEGLKNPEVGLLPFVEQYLFFLRNDDPNNQEVALLQDATAFFANNPRVEFADLPDELVRALRKFINKALEFRDEERFERDREAARRIINSGGRNFVAVSLQGGDQSDSRLGRIAELSRSGMILFENTPLEDLTDEQLERAINRLRRQREEAREQRRQRQREARLFPDPPPGPGDRKRIIEIKRPISNDSLDPILRYYYLNNIPTEIRSAATDDPILDRANLGINLDIVPQILKKVQATNFANSVFVTDNRSISSDVIDWSLGGYAQIENGDRTYSEVRNDESRLLKWKSSFFESEALDPDDEEFYRNDNPNRDREALERFLFQSSEGGDFGQVQSFNLPARITELAEQALPRPVNYTDGVISEGANIRQLLEQSFTIPGTGQVPDPISATALRRMTRMVAIVRSADTFNIGAFIRDVNRDLHNGDPEISLPLNGFEFYEILRDFHQVVSNSVKDQMLAFAGLPEGVARGISKGFFKSFSFYNFRGYTGIARDFYGNKVANSDGNFGGTVFGYITPEYNYFNEKYELATAGSSVPHALLPNFYTYIIASDSELPEQPDDGSVDFLGGKRQSTVRGQSIQQITLGEFSDNLLPSLNNADISEYLSTYAEKVGSGVVTSLGSQLNKLYRNVGVPAGEIDIFDRLNARSALFPMAIKIGVPTSPIGPIGALIEQTGTSTSLMNILVGTSTVSEEFIFKCNAYRAPVSQEDPFAIELPENGVQVANLAIRKRTAIYDFNTWIESVQGARDDIAAIQTRGNSYRAGGERMPDEIITLSDQQFIDNLKTAVQEKAEEVTLSYSNLLQSDYRSTYCHSETFMYKLRKFTTTTAGENPNLVGEFYFPNTQLSKIIEYVDTQVKYEQTYQYELVGYEIVFGSEFRFRTVAYQPDINRRLAVPPTAQNIGPVFYRFNVETLPDIKVIEYPIFSKEWNEQNILGDDFGGGVSYPITRILDRPPIPPNVFISPYKDNYRQILMNFQSMSDDVVQKYIFLSEEEQEKFHNISKTQKRLTNFALEAGHVRFKNESVEEIKEIQIFRTQNMEPSFDLEQSLYNNFKDRLYKTLPSDQGLDIVDTLIPNQKYYYMFRTVDRHDQVSNPSEIYEVLLSYSEGVFIPKIKLFNPEENLVTNSVPSKRMARFIEIKSSDIQSLTYNERDQSGQLLRSRKGLIEDQDNRLTESKFLVRLVSRDTGRKINIVVDFRER